MTLYDWFIICIAIPGMAIGFTALLLIWFVIGYEIWKEYR